MDRKAADPWNSGHGVELGGGAEQPSDIAPVAFGNLRVAGIPAKAVGYRGVAETDGTFPKQIPISTRCAGWRESAINDWMKNPIYYRVEESAQRPA